LLICCERKILLAGCWLLAGAELVWEKSTADWLGASQPNKEIVHWKASQANRVAEAEPAILIKGGPDKYDRIF
jgi:hypothetical protein